MPCSLAYRCQRGKTLHRSPPRSGTAAWWWGQRRSPVGHTPWLLARSFSAGGPRFLYPAGCSHYKERNHVTLLKVSCFLVTIHVNPQTSCNILPNTSAIPLRWTSLEPHLVCHLDNFLHVYVKCDVSSNMVHCFYTPLKIQTCYGKFWTPR